MVGYKTSRYGKILFVLGLLLIPRIHSLLRPTLWVEDEPVLYNAFLNTKGQLPYLDYSITQFPFLESVIAGTFSLFGNPVRTSEVFTQLVILLMSFALFLYVKRSGKETHIALAVAMICACGSIVFRYHVFSREYFVALFVVFASLVAISKTPIRHNAVVSGLLLSLAVVSSLSALAYCVSHILFLLLTGKIRKALSTGATIVIVLVISGLMCYLRFGDTFLTQIDVIGSFTTIPERWSIYITAMPALLLAGGAGILFDLMRQRSQLSLLPFLHIALGSLFMIFCHPKITPRTIIEILPWIALFTGTLFGAMVQALMRMKVDWKPALIDFLIAAGLLSLCILANWAFPVSRREDKSMARSEFEARVRRIHHTTKENEPVNAPGLIALQANRMKATTGESR